MLRIRAFLVFKEGLVDAYVEKA